jgi:hypothetical protein
MAPFYREDLLRLCLPMTHGTDSTDLDGAGGRDQPHGGIDEPREVVTGIEQAGNQHGRLSRQPWRHIDSLAA